MPTGRVLTVPNLLSLLRLAGVPLFLWLLLGPHADGWALVVLMVGGVTDWLDGKLARLLDQFSALGALLDPAADRLYILAALVALAVRDVVPWWAVLLPQQHHGTTSRTASAACHQRGEDVEPVDGGVEQRPEHRVLVHRRASLPSEPVGDAPDHQHDERPAVGVGAEQQPEEQRHPGQPEQAQQVRHREHAPGRHRCREVARAPRDGDDSRATPGGYGRRARSRSTQRHFETWPARARIGLGDSHRPIGRSPPRDPARRRGRTLRRENIGDAACRDKIDSDG